MVWGLSSPAIYPFNFWKVEVRVRNLNLNVVVCGKKKNVVACEDNNLKKKQKKI